MSKIVDMKKIYVDSQNNWNNYSERRKKLDISPKKLDINQKKIGHKKIIKQITMEDYFA